MNCSCRTFFRNSSAALIVTLFVTLNIFGIPTQAAVPQPNAEKFVNALVEDDNGVSYPDIALYYMEQIYKDGTIPPEYKSIYDMEMGRLHMLNSALRSSQDDQLKEIDLAHESFAKFIKENPKHERIRECSRKYAELMVARGTIYRDLSVKSTNKKQEQRDQWMKIARDSFDSAQKEFLANKNRAHDVLKQLKADKKEEGEVFEEAVNDFLQAWLAVASIYYEIAQTYPDAAKEHKDFLEKARKEYNAIFEKYGAIEPPWIAGLYARVREGRILMDLGIFEDPDKVTKGALSIFDETLTLDNNAANRGMREEALLYYLQSAIKYKNDKDPTKKEKMLDQGLQRFTEWYEKDYTASRLSQVTAQQLLLAGCDVAATKISALSDEQKKVRQNVALAKNSLDILNTLLKTDLKDEARAVKEKLGVVGPIENIPPEKMSFAELFKELGACRETIADIQAESSSATTEEQKAAVQKKMLDAGEKFLKIYELVEYRRPIDISGAQLRQLNSNRYLAVYMMFLQQDYYRAIMLADFVVRNYSTDPISETMADLEMKILRSLFMTLAQKMRRDGKSDEEMQAALRFELSKMARLASIIQTRTASKGPDIADNAWACLCDSCVDIGDVKRASVAMNRISENSDRRADCEIRTGNMLWNNYLRGMRADMSVRPSKETLAKYKDESQRILQEGVDRMKKNMGEGEEPSANLVSAAYTLANSKLNSGDAVGALQLLNDPQFGPLTLIKKDSPLVRENERDIRSLRIALRALVAAQQLDDAKAIMDLLEKRVEESDKSEDAAAAEGGKSKEEQLTNIYITLGMELKENLEVFNREGQKEKANALEKGFEVFLEKIGSQPDIKFGAMYWVAQTYQSLGENTVEEEKSVTDKAKEYFAKAVAEYDEILKKIKDQPNFVQKPELTTRIIDERQARCLASGQQYEKAIAKMGEILSKTPNNIDLQSEAVRCYQGWGEATADKEQAAAYLKKALVGCGKDFLTSGQKDPKQNDKPAIWGWNALANKMQTQITKRHSQDPRVISAFYEARLTISKIYVEQAEGMKESDKKLARLQEAEKVLLNTHRAFPTLNDEDTFKSYDTQLKLVRTKMKAINPDVVVQGFSELETAMGFASKGDYREAISRIMAELSNPRTRKKTVEDMQPILAGYYYKWAEKTENSDRSRAAQLYDIALNGDKEQVNDAGKQIFVGWNGVLKTVTNDKGEPIRSSDPEKDRFLDYLQARLSIAEIKFNQALLEIAALEPVPEPADAEKADEAPAEEAPAEDDSEPAEEDASVSESTAGETEEAPADEAPADAVEEDAPVADAESKDEAVNEPKSTQSTEEPAAADDANSSIPPKAKELLNEVKKILREDYDKYKSTQADAEILGNSDILQSYETLMRKVQEKLGEPASGFAPPESLLPKKVEPEAEEVEQPTDPMVIYGILGGIGLVGLIIIIIAFLPKKKKFVEKQKVNVTDDGIAVGSEQFEQKVDLGFAQEEGEAKDKIDLGFGGFDAGAAPAPNGKIDLGFGGPQQDVAFNFDFGKKPAAPNGGNKPAPRPAAQRPAPHQGQRPSPQNPAHKPAPKPVQKPAPKPQTPPEEK